MIGFALCLGVGNLAFLRQNSAPEFIGPGGLTAEDLSTLEVDRVVLPNPQIPPEEVVRLQLAGLGDQRADGVGILQCYAFASPANRLVTGPLERFGQIVRQGPYRCMAQPRALLVGRAQYRDDAARLLVTVVDEQAEVQAFTFFLSRQKDPPFKDCWMTEAVLPSLAPAESSPAEAPPAA